MTMQTTIIRVTQDDLDAGIAANSEACPVARAINRHLDPGMLAVVTGNDYGIMTSAGDALHRGIHLPDEVAAMVRAIDHRKKVVPAKFDINVPEECLR